jgi:hypothetical protein
MSPMNSALISYWHRLPAESPAARRKTLDVIRDRVRAGLEARSALVPFALGDVEDGIVAEAAQAYVATPAGATDADALTEATEWVRRGLALNRGAVFGALLALEDEWVVERLAALRLVLSAAEIESACRVLGAAPGPHATAFLRDWLELISDGPLARERRALSGLLGADRNAWAA